MTDYQDLLIALSLMRLNKRQFLAVLMCYTYYLYQKETPDRVNLKDFSLQLGLDSTVGSITLDSLVDYNILGSIVLKESAVKKEIAQHFNRNFLATLKGKKNLVKQAINRAGFFIEEEAKIYVFNPVVDTWKYSSYSKLRKTLTRLVQRFTENKFLSELIKVKKKGNNGNAKDIVDRINAPYLVKVFMSKFNKLYGKSYTPNWAMDCIKMNNLIRQFEKNNMTAKDIPIFLDWAFEQAEDRKMRIQIGLLRYLANDYIIKDIDKIKRKQKFRENIDGHKFLNKKEAD